MDVLILKEDPKMCEALRDLMKDDLLKERTEGEARGVAIKEAIKLYRDEMGLLPTEIIKKIMARFDLKPDVAAKYVEETLGLQLV